jgi:hypothetical protein
MILALQPYWKVVRISSSNSAFLCLSFFPIALHDPHPHHRRSRRLLSAQTVRLMIQQSMEVGVFLTEQLIELVRHGRGGELLLLPPDAS